MFSLFSTNIKYFIKVHEALFSGTESNHLSFILFNRAAHEIVQQDLNPARTTSYIFWMEIDVGY